MNTWTVVPLPPQKNAMDCRWVYKIEYGSNGAIERHKSILVVKGFNQKEGIDYFKTYSHVTKLYTVKLHLSITLIKQ